MVRNSRQYAYVGKGKEGEREKEYVELIYWSGLRLGLGWGLG